MSEINPINQWREDGIMRDPKQDEIENLRAENATLKEKLNDAGIESHALNARIIELQSMDTKDSQENAVLRAEVKRLTALPGGLSEEEKEAIRVWEVVEKENVSAKRFRGPMFGGHSLTLLALVRRLLPSATVEKAFGDRWCGTCAKVVTPDQQRSAPHRYECLKCGKITTEPPPSKDPK